MTKLRRLIAWLLSGYDAGTIAAQGIT